MHIIGRDQVTTDLPDWRHDKGKPIDEYNGMTRDQRTRGMGGLHASCGEENLLKLGISLNTLDFEPVPYNRVLAQAVAELSGKALGSDSDYQRVTFSVAGYRMVFPHVARIVLAGRGLYSMQFGSVPFFSLPTLAFITRDRTGLGGFATMRGFVDKDDSSATAYEGVLENVYTQVKPSVVNIRVLVSAPAWQLWYPRASL